MKATDIKRNFKNVFCHLANFIFQFTNDTTSDLNENVENTVLTLNLLKNLN